MQKSLNKTTTAITQVLTVKMPALLINNAGIFMVNI